MVLNIAVHIAILASFPSEVSSFPRAHGHQLIKLMIQAAVTTTLSHKLNWISLIGQ